MATKNVLTPEIIYETDITALDKVDIGALINNQLNKLDELGESVQESMKAAKKASDSAKNANSMSAGFGKKKAAIEELQSAGVDLATAVQTGVETQKVSFEFQTMLANISKFLMWLGTSNIANNRIVIQELEMRLKGASEKEISDLAQKEVLMVIKQLKDQQDMFVKQEALTKVVKGHDQLLNEQVNKGQQLDDQLKEKDITDKRQDLLLKNQEEANRKFKEQIEAQAELDKLHDEKLKAQAEIDKLHDEQLKIQVEKDKWLEERIQVQAEVDKLHDEQFKIREEKDQWLEERIQVQAEVDKLHEKQFKIREEKDQWLEEKLLAQAQIDKIHDEHFEDLREKISTNLITINTLNNEIKNLKTLLETKANNKISMVTFGIAIVALALSILKFFI